MEAAMARIIDQIEIAPSRRVGYFGRIAQRFYDARMEKAARVLKQDAHALDALTR
jgi:hypothetical protein